MKYVRTDLYMKLHTELGRLWFTTTGFTLGYQESWTTNRFACIPEKRSEKQLVLNGIKLNIYIPSASTFHRHLHQK